jgi:hypothetical protein
LTGADGFPVSHALRALVRKAFCFGKSMLDFPRPVVRYPRTSGYQKALVLARRTTQASMSCLFLTLLMLTVGAAWLTQLLPVADVVLA